MRNAECAVAQAFVPAGSRDFRVPCFPAFWELELATGKSPLPADKNVGATRASWVSAGRAVKGVTH